MQCARHYSFGRLGSACRFVFTTEFKEAAEGLGHYLGFGLEVVYVPHFIQNRTDDEIEAIVDDVQDSILSLTYR